MDSIEGYKKEIDIYLGRRLPAGRRDLLNKAMRYSVISGGKRIRPILCIAGFNACGGKGSILRIASAIELAHTFSLIHDDLPCMDNDDFRRGRPSSHKVFGEDIATLAGDALLTLSFEWIADTPKISAQKKISIISELSHCLGGKGLIGGQVQDLKTPQNRLFAKTLRHICEKKTGALITASVRIGAIIAGAGKQKLAALTEYGNSLGIAFQIIDDLLDIAQDEKKDISYPRIMGRDKAERYAKNLIKKAAASVKPFKKKAGLLTKIAELVLNRMLVISTN